MKVINYQTFINKVFNIKLMKNKIFTIKEKSIILKIFLKLIYKFHITYKKILFLTKDTNYFHLFSFIKRNTKHLYLANDFWINGFLSNFSVFKHMYLYKKFLFNLKSKNDIHLIINLNKFFYKNEIIKSKILSIFLYKNNLNILDKIQINLFFLLIYEVLKI